MVMLNFIILKSIAKGMEIIQDSLVPDYFRSQQIWRFSLQHIMLLHQRQPKSMEVKLAWQILVGAQIRTIKNHRVTEKLEMLEHHPDPVMGGVRTSDKFRQSLLEKPCC